MDLNFDKVDLGGFGINDTATQARASLGEAVKVNPDEFAKNVKLSRESGVPEFAVQDNPAEIETRLKLDKVDLDQLSTRNPNTAKYLVDFNNAVIAQDDIDVLAGIESSLTTFADVGRSIPAGFVSAFGSAFEGVGRTIDIANRTLARGLDTLLPESADPYIWMTPETPEVLKMAQVLEPQRLLRYEGSGLKLAAANLGAPEDRQNIATDIASAVGNMGGQLLTVLAAPQASLGMLFAQGVDIQGEKQEATGTEGQSLQSDLALLTGGAITAGTEKLGLDAVLNRIPPKIKHDLLRQVSDIAIAGGIEAVQEVAEGVAQNVLEYYTTNPDAEIFEGLGREAIAAGGAGAIVRAVVNALVPGRARTVTDDQMYKEYLGTLEQQKIDGIAQGAIDSKLRERDAESFHQFVQQADGENNTTVFVDGAQAALYLQSKTRDEIAADPALQLLAQGVREAATLGVDVSVPVADFATTIAPSEHFAQLRPHLTMSDQTTTPFRQDQVRTETASFVQRLINEAQDNVSEYVEAQEIYTTIRDQLVDTGMVNQQNANIMAQVVPAWATSYARRQGISVAEAFQRSGLAVQGPQTGEKGRLMMGERVLLQGLQELDTLFTPRLPTKEELDNLGKLEDVDLTNVMESESKDLRGKNKENSEPLINGYGDYPVAVKRSDGKYVLFDGHHRAEDVLSKGSKMMKMHVINVRDYDPTSDKKAAVKDSRNIDDLYKELVSFDNVQQSDNTVLNQPQVQGNEQRSRQGGRDNDQQQTTEPSTYAAAAGRTDAEAVAEFERAKAGQEVTFTHRTRELFDSFDDATLGQNTTTPGASLGHYLSAADVGNADRYGNDLMVTRFTLRNPLVIDAETFADTLADKTPDQVSQMRQRFIDAGHDGVLVNGLNWAIVFEGANLEVVPDNAEAGLFYQSSRFSENNRLSNLSLTGASWDRIRAENPSLKNIDNIDAEITIYRATVGDRIRPDDFVAVNRDIAEVELENVIDRDGTGQIIEQTVKVRDLLMGNDATEFVYYPVTGQSKVDQTETESFKKWFKKSKIVDDAGKPLTVYSGTPADLTDRNFVFDYSRIGDNGRQEGAGFYFTNSKKIAERYGNLISAHLSIQKPLRYDHPGFKKPVLKRLIIEIAKTESEKTGANIADGFLSNFGDVSYEGQSTVVNEAVDNIADDETALDQISGIVGAGADIQTVNEAVRKVTGFDGVIAKGFENAGTENEMIYVAFFPDQVKSIDSSFDANSSNIFEQNQGVARGYYDPANSLIRLTEAADLSTFLHEFAHFMYEMELNTNSEMSQSINNWFKRNAAAVAEEANGYIGDEGQLAQSGVLNSPYSTGKPTKLFYTRNTEKAPRNVAGMDFGQAIEPAGEYMVVGEESFKDNNTPGWVYGTVEFKNPLVLEHKSTRSDGWKKDLSEMFGGKVGKKLTAEIKKQGYDGILTVEPFRNGYALSEAVNLSGVKSDDSLLLQSNTPSGKQGSITPEDVITYLDNKTTGDAAKDSAIRRATHEQFARGFEAYLMEGKSPSIELRNAFRTFARWLVQIYKSIRGLNVNIDNEMRQVFDRLIATEEQIAAAESRARYEPMFTNAAMAGMTDEEFAAYKKRQEKVKDKETETLREKLIQQLTRQAKQWWREEKEDLIRSEAARLNAESVYTARNRLTSGDIKLDHATVKAMVGVTQTDKRGHTFTVIPPSLRGMTAKGQAGVHPDEAAGFFGYNSGSELLDDLMTAPKIMDAAEMAAQQIMIDRHGDIFNDGTIEREADEAVQNEERGKLILDELKALSRGTNQPSLDRQTIQALAEERIGRLSFREIHPGKYRRAEINAAQEAASMLAKGNREGAAAAKARQVLNYYLGMAATNAKNETTKIVDRMSRYNKKDVREEIQKAQNGYWEQIVKILERFEFRKSATLTQVDRVNQDINTWMKERVENDGDGLVLTAAILNESYVTHWKNVPFADLQGISESVKNIEHVARYANKLTRMGEEIDFDKLVARWVDSMNNAGETRFTPKRTDVVEGRNWGRWAMAQMTKIPYMASWLDGGERAGISHQVLVQPFTDAYAEEIRMWDEAGRPVMEAIENRSKEDIKRHNTKYFIKEINDNLYGHQIIAVALNTGNAGNLRKMLLGEGWANPDNDAEISLKNPKLQAVLSRMTKSDWEMVQMIWDRMETLYPQLAEVHRRTTGLVPPKVEATPVETPFGTFKGGYYPVKYDPNRSQQAQENEDKLNAQTESMFSGSLSIQASVNAGATNERTGYYAPIRLSLDVVPSHFQETIHYITHHDPVREINKLIRNKSVADTIKAKLGPEEFAQLRPWLNDIAKDGREAPTKMFWDDILQRLRFGVTLGTMGFKASTGIIQISGLSNTVTEVGLAPVMQAARNILGSVDTMKSAWGFAVSNSKVLEHRAQTMDREIKNAMKALEGKRGILAAAQQASMKHIALIQTYMVDLPSWHAAYIKGMKEWGDETRAFQYADWVIENIQGSGATKDLARIMRGQSETGRMFTMFMTFFSSLWNLQRDLVKGARSGLYSPTNVAAKAMFLFTIPVLFEMMMRGELGGEDDDDESTTQKILTKVALYPFQSVPFLRDIVNGVAGEYGYNISPLASLIEQGTQTIPEVVKRGFTDEEITKGQAKGATKFIGAAVGIPGTSQAWATGEHLYDVIVDGEELTLHQLLFGPKKE